MIRWVSHLGRGYLERGCGRSGLWDRSRSGSWGCVNCCSILLFCFLSLWVFFYGVRVGAYLGLQSCGGRYIIISSLPFTISWHRRVTYRSLKHNPMRPLANISAESPLVNCGDEVLALSCFFHTSLVQVAEDLDVDYHGYILGAD